MRLEAGALFSVDDVRDTKALDELIEKHASNRNHLLIRKCIIFYVLGKVVNDSQNVPVTTLSAGQRAS